MHFISLSPFHALHLFQFFFISKSFISHVKRRPLPLYLPILPCLYNHVIGKQRICCHTFKGCWCRSVFFFSCGKPIWQLNIILQRGGINLNLDFFLYDVPDIAFYVSDKFGFQSDCFQCVISMSFWPIDHLTIWELSEIC